MNCMAVALDPLTDRFTQFSARSSQRCRLQSLDFNTKHTALTHRSVSTPCFSLAATNQDAAAPRIEILGGRKVPTIQALVAEVTIAEVKKIKCKEELPEMSQVCLFPRAPSLSANLSALMMCSWIGTHDRSMVRSKSHPICVNHDETEGVFSGDMSADEWEKHLKAQQARDKKPRFGYSCKF